MTEEELRKIEEEDLPFFYRLILKIPIISLNSSAAGLFWAIICPIFIILSFFFDFIILLSFPFPINCIIAAVVPAIIFVLFLKVMLTRLINWWNNFVVSGYTQRKIDEVIDEYMALVNKRTKNRKN